MQLLTVSLYTRYEMETDDETLNSAMVQWLGFRSLTPTAGVRFPVAELFLIGSW